jgi:hypothetical protein
MFAKKTPFKCGGHTYDSISTVFEDRTFTANSCSYCSEHKAVTAIRKLLKL